MRRRAAARCSARSPITAGRVLAYGSIAAVLALGALGAPAASTTLQRWLPPFLGPLLVLTAMVLLELVRLPWHGSHRDQRTAERLARLGVTGGLLLGTRFALMFCPVSAALFFGSLLPQALAGPSVALPVLAYGIGTALPVAVRPRRRVQRRLRRAFGARLTRNRASASAPERPCSASVST